MNCDNVLIVILALLILLSLKKMICKREYMEDSGVDCSGFGETWGPGIGPPPDGCEKEENDDMGDMGDMSGMDDMGGMSGMGGMGGMSGMGGMGGMGGGGKR